MSQFEVMPPSLCASGWRPRVLVISSRKQALEVCLRRFSERFQVITPFQTTHEAALGVRFGNIEHLLRQRGEIFRLQSERANGIALVGVEAGADED